MKWLIALVLVAGTAAANEEQLAQISDPDVARGVALLEQGDLESALLALDTGIRRLKEDPSAERELARAYLHLGATYVALDQESLGRVKLREALRHDPDITPDPTRFPPSVLRVFEQAREARDERAGLETEVTKGRAKKPLLLVGGGVAAAGGLAYGLTRERENLPPTASFRITPSGGAIPGVTSLLFEATGSDPDGEPLSYDWDFGDDDLQQFCEHGVVGSASGPLAAHVYWGVGTARVTLTVRDGLTSVVVEESVIVNSLGGAWVPTTPLPQGESVFRFNHTCGLLTYVSVRDAAGNVLTGGVDINGSGAVLDPRSLRLRYSTLDCSAAFDAEVNSSLSTLTGTLTYSGGSRSGCPVIGQTLSVVLQRR